MIDSAASTALPTDGFAAMRDAMVASQLRTNAVNDARVLAAMARVPREEFVPDAARALAYADRPIALGGGRAMNGAEATGLLLTQARLTADDRVLLIGAARGYAAALLAVTVGDVVAVEEDAALAAAARDALAGYARATLVEGPLAAGAPDHPPFDVLVIDGAVAQVPDSLAAQVKPGGRVVAGLSDRGVTRLASGVVAGGRAALMPFADHDCVALPGFAMPRGFVF